MDVTNYKYLILSLVVAIASCTTCNDQGAQNKKEKSDGFSGFELTVERGAFHYDKFVLKDMSITFYPSQPNMGEDYKMYCDTSVRQITKVQRDIFAKKIIDGGVLSMKDEYRNHSSCDSHMTITIKYSGKVKKIVCEDYIRGCPGLLQFIEAEIVRLHGKGLKRVVLPG